MACGCGCNGAAGGCGAMAPQTIGLLFSWPSDVRDLKLRIDPSMAATDAAVSSCSTLEPGARKAWKDFHASWLVFRNQGEGWFGSAAQYDEGLIWQKQLGEWQTEVRKLCAIPGPQVSTEDPGAGLQSAVKWAAAALIAVALVYGVRTVLK